MAETYQPYFESTAEKEDDKKAEKKDQKKHAAQAELHPPKSAEHTAGDRPQKLGGELLRPLRIELPKQPDSETDAKQKEREPAASPVEAVRLPDEARAAVPEELQHAYDELLAAAPEAIDDDDEEIDKPKKRTTEAKTDEAAVPESEASEQEHDDDAAAPDTVFPALEQVPEPAAAPSHEAPAIVMPEASADEADPDHVAEGFAAASTDESPPVESPIALDAGGEEPPIPPTAEAGSWDDEPWEQPAGGLGAPATREAINAVDNRRELDDLYHTSRENGLAGAVGIIGLGLILEHFAAKRRDKRLKRQLDVQNRQLRKTNDALKLEHRSSQTTSRKLEQLHTVQTTTNEHLQKVTTSSIEQSAKIAAAAVAGSVIGRAAERGKTKMTPAQERVLAERLEHSKELGHAIKRNPELKDVYDLKQSLEVAATTAHEQERQIDGLNREVSHERLQRKQADADRTPKLGGGGVDASGMPMLPSPQHQLTTGLEPDHLLEAHAHPDKKLPVPGLAWVAVATVLVVLAAVFVMVYIR